MSGKSIQLTGNGLLAVLDDNGTKTGEYMQHPSAAENPVESPPARALPTAHKVVGRIGKPPEAPHEKQRSFAAELRERRKFLEREVKKLRRLETELGEVNQMLAAIKPTARKTS